MNRSTVNVLPMSDALVPRVCALHREAFRGLMSARLGRNYLDAFMSWFLHSETAIALVAVDENGALLGYVIGAPSGYGAAMNRDLVWVAARCMIVRPWLFLDSQVRATIKARLQFMLGHPAATANDLPTPTMSLVGIAVSPEAAGKGVGSLLVKTFESRARVLNMASLHLSVYPDNTVARRLYERCGWHALNTASSTGAMYYGRVLSDISSAAASQR
jgi:ribosomal protein S18 acetylase RimI-like enzyme